MGNGRKPQYFRTTGSMPSSPFQGSRYPFRRDLDKIQLGGVIFGCKTHDMEECLSKQLFGLTAPHFPYVKNIDPGLPLFLFNYNDKKLHGIFESASFGRMNIDPYAWTTGSSERTSFPAQVQIRVRLQCQPLLEDQFRPIIADNYYTPNHFWFELDHDQTSQLISLFSSLAVAPSAPPRQKTEWRPVSRAFPLQETGDELASAVGESSQSGNETDPGEVASSFHGESQPMEAPLYRRVVNEEEKNLILMKFKRLALDHKYRDLLLAGNVRDTAAKNDKHSVESDSSPKNAMTSEHFEPEGSKEKTDEALCSSSEYQAIIAKLLEDVQELKDSKTEQAQRICYLEQKLIEAEVKIKQLKTDFMMLNSESKIDETVVPSYKELDLNHTEEIFLIGGYDGTCLSSFESYQPSQNVVKSLRPLSSVRSHASVSWLNGELYVFGGGNCHHAWYNTVESYSPETDQWTPRPSLKEKKGSLGGATMSNKLFAIGGGNATEAFAEVEMLDLNLGKWIFARSMQQKRFAVAAVELNGVLYATGGYDGNDYLTSAERFDPREISWSMIPPMSAKRGGHSLVVMNEKLYALGGFDGSQMLSTVEIYDPRMCRWIPGETMNRSRAYSAAVSMKESVYIIGGKKAKDELLDTIEVYKEGEGWRELKMRNIGRRCYLSVIPSLQLR